MPPVLSNRPSWHPVAIGLGGTFGLLIAVTALLWLHYGTAVFYETILAGLALCF